MPHCGQYSETLRSEQLMCDTNQWMLNDRNTIHLAQTMWIHFRHHLQHCQIAKQQQFESQTSPVLCIVVQRCEMVFDFFI